MLCEPSLIQKPITYYNHHMYRIHTVIYEEELNLKKIDFKLNQKMSALKYPNP